MKLTNEICISFLQGSGWMYNHDKEITISERNKAIDDFSTTIKEEYKNININQIAKYTLYCYADKISEELKRGEKYEIN